MLQLRSSSDVPWICQPIHLVFPDNTCSWWIISMESGRYVIPEALDSWKPHEAREKQLMLKERLMPTYKLNPCYLAEKPGLLVSYNSYDMLFFPHNLIYFTEFYRYVFYMGLVGWFYFMFALSVQRSHMLLPEQKM